MRGGKKRFTCDKLLELSRKLAEAERIFKKRMVPLIRDMFLRFYSYREHWTNAVNCVAELDVLCSLAAFSCQAGMCKPQLSLSETQPELRIEGLRNPLFVNSATYVPNDVTLGKEGASCLLITGPNMGGKSTLLRATALAVVLAQIGCYVPAQSYKGTLIDRIFTRIGAEDHILSNKSTFFVELEETNQILQQAT